MEKAFDYILSFGNTFLTLVTLVIVYYLAKFVLDRQSKGKTDGSLVRSIILFSIAIVGGIALILSIPMDQSLKGQITQLLGIVISAILALSSATFFGNGLAGIMLRTIDNFKPGDFITINEHFGRISERGLFHTEIQTENRDLTTLPNLYLVNNPLKVTRSSGTFISGACSLGYDVNRRLIEKTLLEAATKAGLSDAFVRITELGDYSVLYKVYGLLADIKMVLSSQSRLHAMMLDELHAAGIEIVSPTFMNQRLVTETVFIPKKTRRKEIVPQGDDPEKMIFDKADEAETIEKQKELLADIEKKLKTLNEDLKGAEGEDAKKEIENRLEKWEKIKEKMLKRIDEKINEIKDKK